MTQLHSGFGLAVLVGLAWLLGENRRAVSWRIPVVGVVMQVGIALLLLKLPQSRALFAALNDAVRALQAASEAGTSFVFGYLGGGPLPFEETTLGGSLVLAFRSLPLVIVVSALTSLLTYWRVLPIIVRGLSSVFERTFRVGGAVALSTAANIFLGMVEAPLFIRGYLRQLSRGELFMVMCTGMASIAGTVFFLYVTILGPVIPDAAGQLLTASIMSAPASIMIAWLMVPPEGKPTAGSLSPATLQATSSMDAVTQGTERGLALYLNIVAMLIVLVALVQLANSVLGLLPGVGGAPLTLERMLGWVMAPVVWLMGVPWSEAPLAGSLMGIKTVLNEFLAYLELAKIDMGLSERTRLIMTYALCGMANFGSLGIMIGGLTAMVPERRQEIVALGMKSIVGGTIATCCTGAVVGMIIA
ncbi:MAG TPA: nucleoside transporter C-terminal domain-containing protein [Gammaproteobacteria bacterium]|nr:nucleoside transporter C-terminal domain-containing protein [Gammaproteobacteria bacterium]